MPEAKVKSTGTMGLREKMENYYTAKDREKAAAAEEMERRRGLSSKEEAFTEEYLNNKTAEEIKAVLDDDLISHWQYALTLRAWHKALEQEFEYEYSDRPKRTQGEQHRGTWVRGWSDMKDAYCRDINPPRLAKKAHHRPDTLSKKGLPIKQECY